MRHSPRSLPSLGLILLVSGTAPLLAGCPGQDGFDRDPAEDCSGEGVPDSAEGLPTVEIAIGHGLEDDAFEAYADGDTMPLQSGFQGFEMLTPDFRVATSAASGESQCLRVELVHETVDGEVIDGEYGYYEYIVFTPDDDGLVAGPLFDTLGTDGDGSLLRLRARIIGPDFAGETSVDVQLAR